MRQRFIRIANGIVTCIEVLLLLIVGAYACYALWDNNQVYQETEDVRAELLKLKPFTEGTAEEPPSFEELLKINTDVCAWITMDHTCIDYPVVQGETNLTYINTDVYGNFSLAGSIFLDTRCDREFQDSYSLLYGHHMNNHLMFGDLDLYKEKAFFEENRTGTLILPSGVKKLETLGCMLVYASDDKIFEPQQWDGQVQELMAYLREEGLHYDETAVAAVEAEAAAYAQGITEKQPQIVALTTCANDFTEARMILLTVMWE